MTIIAFLSIVLFLQGNSGFHTYIFNRYSPFRYGRNCESGTKLSSKEFDNICNYPDNISGSPKTGVMQLLSSFATFSSIATIALVGKNVNAEESVPIKAKKPKVLEVQFKIYVRCSIPISETSLL